MMVFKSFRVLTALISATMIIGCEDSAPPPPALSESHEARVSPSVAEGPYSENTGVVAESGTTENTSEEITAAPVTIDTADTESNRHYYADIDNSGRLTGDRFGVGSKASSEYVEKLSIFGNYGNEPVIPVGVYAVDDAFRSDEHSLVIVLRNNSNDLHCRVKLWSFNLLMKDGTVATKAESSRKQEFTVQTSGIIHKYTDPSGNSRLENACIPAKSMVYAQTEINETIDFGSVAGITGGKIKSVTNRAGYTRIKHIRPLSYKTNKNGNLVIQLKNLSSSESHVPEGYLYLLDEHGWPMTRLPFAVSPAIEPEQIGAIELKSRRLDRFRGTASAMRVVITNTIY